MDERATSAKEGKGWRRFAPLAVLALGLAAVWLSGAHEHITLEALGRSRVVLKSTVAAHPLAAAAAFMAVYVAAVALSLPAASALSVFGGFLFGWLQAGVMVAFSATLGACLLFLAARSALGGALRRRVSGFADGLAQGFEDNAFFYLLAMRLAPFLPFFVVNVAPALFRVRLSTYAAATFLGILPATFAFCYLGQGVESVLIAAEAAGRAPSVGDLVTPEIALAFAALAVVALIPVVLRHWRSAGRGAGAARRP